MASFPWVFLVMMLELGSDRFEEILTYSLVFYGFYLIWLGLGFFMMIVYDFLGYLTAAKVP